MNQPKPSYARNMEVLAELAEFGASLAYHFGEAWPAHRERLKLNDSSDALVRSLKFSVHGMFQQIRFDITLPAPSINTHNNYKRLSTSFAAGSMLNLLSTYPELEPLRLLTDAAQDCYWAFTNTNPETPAHLIRDRLSEILGLLMFATERLGRPLLSVGIRYPKLDDLLSRYWAARREDEIKDEIKEAESTMPIPLFALPSEHQVKALTRVDLVSLLTSPEAATALKALGYTSVGPTMPLQVLRGLVEALRAAQASPMLGAKSTRIPCLRFSDALLAKTVMGSQSALNQIVAKLNARGDLYPDLDIEIPNPDVAELVLTWKVYSQDTEPQYVGRELVSNARPVLDTHRIVVTSTDNGNLRFDHDGLASNQWVTAIPEIKDAILSATVLCRVVLNASLKIPYLHEPGTFAALVHRSLREAEFGLTMSELWDALCEFGLPDLAKHFEPEFNPNSLKIEWRAWSAISGPPHRIEINDTQDKHLHLTLLRMNLGAGTYQPVYTSTAKRTLQDVLGIAASLYCEALHECHVNPKLIEAPPGTFAQEIATASPLGPWDEAPDKDGHDPLYYLPF